MEPGLGTWIVHMYHWTSGDELCFHHHGLLLSRAHKHPSLLRFAIAAQSCIHFANSPSLPGGSYGFARVTLGPFLGFMVGCCDALRNLAWVVKGVWSFSNLLEQTIGSRSALRPVLWLVFFIPSMLMDHFGGNVFWTAIAALPSSPCCWCCCMCWLPLLT